MIFSYDEASNFTEEQYEYLHSHRGKNMSKIIILANSDSIPARTKPTPEQIRNVRGNFCNLTDSKGRVIFMPFIMSLPSDEREEWYSLLRAAGGTHITLAVTYFYHSAENVYPIPGKDWRDDILGWVKLFWEAVDHGFIPDVALTQGDGSWDDVNSDSMWFYYHGIQLVNKIFLTSWKYNGEKINEWALWRYEWEADPPSFEYCIPVLREAVGENAQISIHMQTDYLDPSGDGNAFWRKPEIIAANINVFLYQNYPYMPGELDQYGQPLWENSAIQSADRIFPTGSPMPGAQGHLYYDSRSGTTLTHPGYALGPRYIPDNVTTCFFECVAYWYTRHRVNDQQVKEVRERAGTFGYNLFGNGTL